MNIKLNKWHSLSLRVILFFATAMIVSFSPDLLRDFFDDKPVPANELGFKWSSGEIDIDWYWGFRHYLYFFMCIALFLIQGIRLAKWIQKHAKEFTP